VKQQMELVKTCADLVRQQAEICDKQRTEDISQRTLAIWMQVLQTAALIDRKTDATDALVEKKADETNDLINKHAASLDHKFEQMMENQRVKEAKEKETVDTTALNELQALCSNMWKDNQKEREARERSERENQRLMKENSGELLINPFFVVIRD
jgi:hypothetical protein